MFQTKKSASFFLGAIFSVSVLIAAPPAADPGKKLYDAKCASCHGKNGKGSPAMAKAFKVAPAALDLTSQPVAEKKDEDLLKTIADGKNKMPAYAKQLKVEERDLVLQYMKSLAPKK